MTNLEAKVTEINIKLNRLCRCFCSRVATCLGIDTEDHSALFLAKDGTWKPVASGGYFRYVAILNESSPNPISFVLENTLGSTIVWTKTSTGVYNGYIDTSGGAIGFTQYKTVIFDSNPNKVDINSIINIRRVDDNNIEIATMLPDGTLDDAFLNEYSVEIRVYP